jgi:uncharacterized membrane protein YbhN (UPF0104 family)
VRVAPPAGRVTASWSRRLLRVAVTVAALAFLLRFLEGQHIARLASALRQSNLTLLAAAALLNLTVLTAARLRRSLAILGPLPRLDGTRNPPSVVPSLLVIQSANALLPARAGDALYPLLLHKRHGYPLGTIVTAQFAEKVVQALSLWVMAVAALALLDPPSALDWPLRAFALLGLGATLSLLPIYSRRAAPPAEGPTTRIGGFLRRGREAVGLLRAPRVWSRALFWAWLSDLIDLCTIGLCLAAVAAPVAPAGWILVMLAINLGTALPGTPAQVGPLEAGAVLALGGLGVAPVEAMAFALVYHLAQLLPMAILGAVGWVYLRSAVAAPLVSERQREVVGQTRPC